MKNSIFNAVCKTRYLALLVVLILTCGNVWGVDYTYSFTINANDFNTTSYAANNNEKTTKAVCTTDATKKMDVSWTSYQVMKNSTNMQWQKSKGYIYNSTDLGTINSVTVTSSAGSFTTYYGTSEQPSSGSSGSGKGYFKTSVGSATGTTSRIVINFTISEGGGSTPSLTPTPTSLDWGSVLQSSSQSTKTFDISGSNLTGNLSVAVTGGYSVSCGSSITVTSGTPNVTTITVTPPSTATAGTKNGKVTISGGGLASNVEVNLTMTVQASHTVTWMVNGSEHATTQVADGSKPTFPSTPSSCDGTSTTFVGWTPTPWSGKLDDVSAKTIYTSGSAMPNVSGPVTYHAVFAKETSTLTPVANTWTRITSTSQLTDGATVMLVQYYSDYAINNTPGATSCTANAEITNSNAALRWIAVKSGSKWKFKTSGGAYLSTNALDNNTNLGLNQTYDEWTISTDNGGTTGSNNTYTNTNCFRLNNGSDLEYYSGVFKLYTWSLKYSSAYPFYIYIQKTTGSTTYSQYLTTCCTSWSDPTFSYNTYSLTAGGAHATKTITGTTHGTLSFESSNTDVITVNSSTGEVTPVGAGTAYVIAHWTEADGYCAKDLNSSTFTVSGNVTVTFKKNGGTGTDDQTQSVPYNTATALKTLAQVGYTAPSCKEFYGWADSQAKADAGTRDYTDGQNVTLTAGVTLYAVWKTIQYTVARGTGTATGCSGGTFTFSPSTVDCGGTVTITSSPDDNHKGSPTVTILPAGSGTVSGNTITGVSGNITSISVSYAEKVDVTATWNVNNGSVTGGETTTQKEGSTFTFPNVTSTDCGTFLGWTNAANSEYSSTSGKPTPFYSVGSTIVLNENTQFYAVYSKVGDDAVAGTLYQYNNDGTDLDDDTHGVTPNKSVTNKNSAPWIGFESVGNYIIWDLGGTPTSFSAYLVSSTGGTGSGQSTMVLEQGDKDGGVYTWDATPIATRSTSSSSTEISMNITDASKFEKSHLRLRMSEKRMNIRMGAVTINGLIATITYTTNPGCVDWVLDAISVTTAPTKTTYNECEEFDPAGMVVTGSYYENGNPSNTTTKDVAGYTWSPEQFLTPGNTIPVTITYTEKAVTKTTTYNVRVNDLTNYTITFHDGGNTTTWTQSNHCDACNLDSRTGSLACGDYTFAGWSSSSTSYDDQSATITTWVTGSYVPTANTDLYAVYRKGATPPAFTANCEGGTFYIYEANGNTHMAGRVNNTPRAYTSEYWNDDCLSCEGDDGTPFTFTRIAENTYKIQNHDGEYLRKYSSGYHPDFESTWYNEDNFKWIISTGTNGTWRFTNKAATDYALVKSGNYFDFQLASNVTAQSSYYDLELTPAASTVYQSNPNCGSPYTITFETHGGTFVQGNYAYSTTSTSGLTDPTVSKFPSATMTGCTFAGWKEGSAQDEITSNAAEADESDAPAGLYAANADLSVSSNKTYHAVYHYYDDNWTFDPSEGGTYHMYSLISDTKHYISSTPTNSWGYLTTSTDCADVTDVTITPGTGANAGKYTIAVGGYNIIPEDGGTKFKRGDFWWTITDRGDGTYAINGMNNNRNIVCGSSGSQFEHCAYNAQGSYSGWYYPHLGRCRQHHWTSDPTLTPLISLGQTGNITVTSTNGKTIKATNKLTLSATRYGTTTKIYLSANVAGVGFLKADGTALSSDSHGSYVSTDASGELATTNIVVTYNPTVTTDGIETVTITAQDNSSPSILATATRTIRVRHLPAKFLIATKVGDDWYALPNNMSSYGNPAAIKLSSVNETTGVATYYSDQYDGEEVGSKNYLTWALYAPVNSDNANYGYKQHGDRVRFADTYGTAHYLEFKASDDDIKNSVSNPGTSDHPLCELLPGTDNLIDYTLLNEGQSKYLGVNESKLWGAYVGSTTVRFLVPNQQPAPTITWRNNTLQPEDPYYTHATNKAENGVVTLPSGDDPVSCNTTLMPTFCGWSASEPTGNYWTAAPSYITEGTAATENTTYYAVFKDATRNRWYTQCQTYYTLTFQDGLGGSDYVTYTENTTYALPDATTTGFSNTGYTLSGWTTTVNVTVGGNTITAGDVISIGSTVSGISGDMTFTAAWAGHLSITGNVRLTSYNGVQVYTTAEKNNMITVRTPSVAGATGIELSYLDANGDPIADKNNSLFRLYKTNYNSEDAAGITLADRLAELTLSEGIYSCTYAIGYQPTSYNTTNTGYIKLVMKRNSTILSEETFQVYGRSLPQKFVIAANINGQWRALPADLATASGTPVQDAYVIGVDNVATPTVAYAPKEAIYSGAARHQPTKHVGGIRLHTETGTSDGYLQAPRSNSSTYLWRASTNSNTGMQDWYLTSNDFVTYNIGVDPSIHVSGTTDDSDDDSGDVSQSLLTRYLCVYNHQIMWSNTSAKDFRILPVTEYEPVTLQVVEWKSTGVVFMYLGNPDYEAEVKIGSVTKASAAELSTLRVDKGVYEIAVSDLMSSVNQAMYIIIKNDGTEVGRKQVMVPLMVNTTTTVNTARTGAGISNKDNCKNIDLVVLSPSVLTADDATAHQFKTITVYGGAKLVVAAGKALTALEGMYLRAGTVNSGVYQYVYPQVYIGSGATLTVPENIINFDYLTTKNQYYALAMPYGTTINNTNIFYPEDIYGSYKTGSYLMDMFNSATRASQGAVDAVWNDVEDVVPTRGLGYYFLGMPRKMSINGGTAERQEYGIQRIKMNVTNASTLATNENTNASISLTYQVSDQVYNAGWNLLGSPFMADMTTGNTDGMTDNGGDNNVIYGNLTFSENTWDNNKAIRYITVPNDEAMETYDQRLVKDYNFPAFKTFYVQIGKNGTITFDQSRRSNEAPARLLMANKKPQEIEFSIALNPEAGAGDTTHLLLGDAFSEDYEIGDDMVKMSHAGVSLFTIMKGNDLFANAIPAAIALNGIPVGYNATEAGEMIFSVNDKDDYTWVKHVWLTDYDKNTKTDLLVEEYPFTTDVGENRTRFALNVELKAEEDISSNVEQIEDVEAVDGPIKFIYQDKMYILNRGVIYDATGKRVREINK